MYKDKTLEIIDAWDAYYKQKDKEERYQRKQVLEDKIKNMDFEKRSQVKASQSKELAALFMTNFFSHCVRDVIEDDNGKLEINLKSIEKTRAFKYPCFLSSKEVLALLPTEEDSTRYKCKVKQYKIIFWK